MSLKSKFREFRHNYIKNQVANIKIPSFPIEEIIRLGIVFSGRVQNVGFRIEVEQLALRLGLTGSVKNHANGDVEAEIQGTENKIMFLVDFMKSLKRMKILKITYNRLAIIETENDFVIVR